jgi:dynein heavy chain
MNSVMDDSRLLTLPSNERIRLLPHMKMIFEIRDLKYATPATATRAGILYVSEGRQWHNMVQSWLQRVVRPYAEKAKWKVRLTQLLRVLYCPKWINWVHHWKSLHI